MKQQTKTHTPQHTHTLHFPSGFMAEMAKSTDHHRHHLIGNDESFSLLSPLLSRFFSLFSPWIFDMTWSTPMQNAKQALLLLRACWGIIDHQLTMSSCNRLILASWMACWLEVTYIFGLNHLIHLFIRSLIGCQLPMIMSMCTTNLAIIIGLIDCMHSFFRERRNVDHAINVIGMPVRPTLGIIASGHNTSGAWLLTPLWVGTILTKLARCLWTFLSSHIMQSPI